MLKHYKKLIVLLIVLAVGFFLALALGEEPSEITWEDNSTWFISRAVQDLADANYERYEKHFDPNYIHHLTDGLGTTHTSFTLEETMTWASRFGVPPNLWLHIDFEELIIAGNKAVVRFSRYLCDPLDDNSPAMLWIRAHFSSEIWILHIDNGKIVEGWSVTDDTPYEQYNKALIKKSFNSLACGDVEQWYEFFDPNYIHHFDSGFALTLEPLEQIALMYSYDLNSGYQQSPYPVVEDMIAEGDKVVVYVIRMGDMYDWFKEIWILRIANGQIVEGWSAQEVLGWGRPPVQPWPE